MDDWHAYRPSRTPQERRASRILHVTGLLVGILLGAIVFAILRDGSQLSDVRRWLGLAP